MGVWRNAQSAEGGAPVGTHRVQQSIIVGKSVFTLLLIVHHMDRRDRGERTALKPIPLANGRCASDKESKLCHPRAPRARQVKQNAKSTHHKSQSKRGDKPVKGLVWALRVSQASLRFVITFAEASKKVHSLLSHHVKAVLGAGGEGGQGGRGRAGRADLRSGRHSVLLSFDNLSPHRRCLEHKFYPSA